MKLKIMVCLMALFASACATAPMDTAKPVRRTGNWFMGHHYFQEDGKELSQSDMINKLSANTKTQADIARVKTWNGVGLAFMGAAIGLAVGSFASEKPLKTSLLFGALGAVACENTAFMLSKSALVDAVETYNTGFGETGKPKAAVAPALSPEGKVEGAFGALSFAF